MAFDRSRLSDTWQRAFDFVEGSVGGRIVAAERQARWRPAWFLELECTDGPRAVYFRGARAEAERGVDQLRHEHRCLELLARHDLPVPRVYGFCPDPAGIVMDRAPGRVSLASAESEAERVAVRSHYMELLARVHELPTAEFEAAGMGRPRTPRDLALGDLDRWVGAYRAAKRRPEPVIEFALRWLARNVPVERERASFVLGDAGQFLFERGRVTALIDVELAYVGDAAADLGALLSRDLSEPMGDLEHALRHYETVRGEPVDRRTVLYHAVRFALVTPLATAAVVARPPAAADYVQYLAWFLVFARCPLELVAHLEGVEIEPPPLPDPAPEAPWTAGHEALRERIAGLERDDPFGRYQLDALARLAHYLGRAERFGAALEAADLDEAGALLGARPRNAAERDAALEAYVASAPDGPSPALLRYLVRRLRRQEFLLDGELRELAGARMQTLGG